jgi:hypothetical protein
MTLTESSSLRIEDAKYGDTAGLEVAILGFLPILQHSSDKLILIMEGCETLEESCERTSRFWP